MAKVNSQVLGAWVVAVWALGCRPELDAPDAKLAIPQSLPEFKLWPDPAYSLVRAGELLERGSNELGAGQLHTAISTLTEALATCPADARARLALARVFARNGRASVALRLLEPAKAAVANCGTCLELLQQVRGDPDFAHLRATAQGQALLQGVAAAPLPYAKWAGELAAILRKGDDAAAAAWAHPGFAFELQRSCPQCANASAHAVQKRALVGPIAISKLAQRFDTVHPELHGAPLEVAGVPRCSDGCCSWPTNREIASNGVLLQRLCFRPMTPERAIVTQVAVVYGQTDR